MKGYRHIGLIFDDAVERHRAIRRGIYAVARPYLPWGFHSVSPAVLQRSPQVVAEADGLIGFWGEETHARLRTLLPTAPLLCLTPMREAAREGPGVDFEKVGALAGRTFRERGFRHIALVGNPRRPRHAALRAGLERETEEGCAHCFEPGGPYPPVPLRRGVRADFALNLFFFLAALPDPCAVVAEDATKGLEVVEICRRTGIAVPGRLAVLAAEDGEKAEMAFPACSAIALPWQRVGRLAVERMRKALAGEPPGASKEAPGPLRVVHRQSTDIFAVRDPHIRQALQLIRDEACHGLTVDDILRRVARPRRWLERRFKEHTGVTPLREIHRVRFERACALLAGTDRTLEEIAENCGFGSLTRFSVAFRKAHGMSPGQYRKSH